MTIAIQVQHCGRALRRLPLLAALALASAGALAGTPINERAAADARLDGCRSVRSHLPSYCAPT